MEGFSGLLGVAGGVFPAGRGFSGLLEGFFRLVSYWSPDRGVEGLFRLVDLEGDGSGK